MKSEFEAPIYANVGQPEPIRIPTGPMGFDRAAEVLGLRIEAVMELVAEGKLRRWRTDQAVISGASGLIHAEDVYRLLQARQQG